VWPPTASFAAIYSHVEALSLPHLSHVRNSEVQQPKPKKATWASECKRLRTLNNATIIEQKTR
jgi:hypothetical protein